mgnify:CR=1 FL=1|tara:strand:- start:459 stop:1283 length:825 start_codon:yes stop_codon:yes gene_type:complete
MIKKVRDLVKGILAKAPFIDGIFRRFVWSNLAYPEFEMKLLSKLDSSSINIALDIGAALGSYSWILKNKSKKVYAFEPGSLHFNYLNKVNFFTNIEVVNCAVGAKTDNKVMYTAGEDNAAMHTATLSKSNPVSLASNIVETSVEQIALDSFFAAQIREGDKIDFIKIDVEGYELEVLEGGRNLIKTFHPLIICEIEWRHNSQYKEVFEFLYNLGYKCEYFANGCLNKISNSDIIDLQKPEDLSSRLDGEVSPAKNTYINNFIFIHPKTMLSLPQ